MRCKPHSERERTNPLLTVSHKTLSMKGKSPLLGNELSLTKQHVVWDAWISAGAWIHGISHRVGSSASQIKPWRSGWVSLTQQSQIGSPWWCGCKSTSLVRVEFGVFFFGDFCHWCHPVQSLWVFHEWNETGWNLLNYSYLSHHSRSRIFFHVSFKTNLGPTFLWRCDQESCRNLQARKICENFAC